ncbi:MAG: hypothetical protein EA353_14790 [Puniceicoccaceae bacterium]|nr:MAG: hypothetical protein EA353_14790 [Puniceicoccaceae bacterium]
MSSEPIVRRYRFAPVTLLALAIALGVGVMVTVTLLAQQQAWLGLKLAPAEVNQCAVVRSSVGPSAAIPPGTRLVSVESGDERIELLSLDLTTEPDGAMGTFSTYREFLERQSRLARIQASPEICFMSDTGETFIVHPHLSGRPLRNLPPDFWVQCLVGLVAWLVSAAVFAFRQGDSAARYLLLSGAATLLFAPAAAVYTTRELAVPGALLQWASDLNFFGGSLFAASFVGLLLVYPRRIAPTWLGPAVVGLFVIWFGAQYLDVFESMTFARRFLVMVAVATTFGLAAVHWRISRGDPLARAKLQWFLLSWVVGTGAFALFILLPQTLGVDTSPIQGYAFLLFLLVYGGLALGILRYRLFELGNWWRRVITWMLIVLLLVVLDLFFLYGLHLSSGTSLAVALVVCGVVWLPLRGWLWQRFAGQKTENATALFHRVMNVALVPPGKESAIARWRAVMASVFNPVGITECTAHDPERILIEEDGLALILPPVGQLPALRLAYAQHGHALFHPRDAALASELVAMVKYAFESLAAYEQGVCEERSRIARDLHDTIGAQLLSALHSLDAPSKDLRIRESLTDLRGVINNAFDGPDSIADTLAELRVETAERLEAAGIQMEWKQSGPDVTHVTAATCHALRSIMREAVSNVIRHTLADRVEISIQNHASELRLRLRDNGRGLPKEPSHGGCGLGNMRQRVRALNGSFSLRSLGNGTCLEASIPISTT